MLKQTHPHFYPLEIIRFIAAFTIMYGHYVHFFMFQNVNYSNTLFDVFLNPYGHLAIPIFFLISGFIFMHVYFYEIVNFDISFYQFIKRRIARLYPLHFLTLILVLILQLLVLAAFGEFFIYQNNDIHHFVLNLTMISYWGFENGNSFNGPFWSVSVEFLIYILFFLVVSRLPSYKAAKIILFCSPVLILVFHETVFPTVITKCVFYYFSGCSLYVVIEILFKMQEKIRELSLTFILVALFVCYLYLRKNYGIFFDFILCPIIMVIFIYLEFETKLFKARLFTVNGKFLGDLTYSTYLLHFPVQLMFILFDLYIMKLNFFSSAILLFYIVCVIFFSTISFKYFENPMRKYVNSIFN